MFKEKMYFGVRGSVYYTPLDDTYDNAFSSAVGSNLIIGRNTHNYSLKPTYNIRALA